MPQSDHVGRLGRTILQSGFHRAALVPALRRPLVLAALVCAAATLLIGLQYAGTSAAAPIDDLMRGAAGAVSDSIGFALVLDSGGEPKGAITFILVISLVCVAARRWRLALLTVTSQGLIGAMTNVVKPLFDRTIHGGFLSYPSGHTAGAAAFALVVALLIADLTRARTSVALILVFGATCGIGVAAAWAQTLLEAHYATDTIGGLCFAVALVVPLAVLLDAVVNRLIGPYELAHTGHSEIA